MSAPDDISTRQVCDSDENKDSGLVRKLGYYMDITDLERDLLAGLETAERSVRANEEIFVGGGRNDNLFVVKYGWLYTYSNVPDGGRLLVRVYDAGDVIGMSTLAFDHHIVNLRAATEGCICPFPKTALGPLMKDAPRLTALWFTLAAREETVLVDTLRATSRMRPDSRIAHLLLSLHARLRITNSRLTDRFRLPLNQTDIGDAVGLSNVTVSRTFSAMESKGLIERCDGEIILTDPKKLGQLCDFHDRYSKMDTSWFLGDPALLA